VTVAGSRQVQGRLRIECTTNQDQRGSCEGREKSLACRAIRLEGVQLGGEVEGGTLLGMHGQVWERKKGGKISIK